MDTVKVRFSLRSAGRGFTARGLDVPITADAVDLKELRRKLASATRTFFGQERAFSMLVGVREPTFDGPQAVPDGRK
jgi:hypothetical protein